MLKDGRCREGIQMANVDECIESGDDQLTTKRRRITIKRELREKEEQNNLTIIADF